jgi:hypothetical protein
MTGWWRAASSGHRDRTMMPMPRARKPLSLEKVENHRRLSQREEIISRYDAMHHPRVKSSAGVLAIS